MKTSLLHIKITTRNGSEVKFIASIKENPVSLDYEIILIVGIIEDEKIITTMKYVVAIDEQLAAKLRILLNVLEYNVKILNYISNVNG